MEASISIPKVKNRGMCNIGNTSPCFLFDYRAVVFSATFRSGAFLATLVEGGGGFRDQLVQVVDECRCFF